MDTREALVDAAALELNSVGYHGTNTNKIARLAGFAPQTFYRHFEDKIDIFLAVYDAWQERERSAIAHAVRSSATEDAVAKAILQHHLEWRIFRHSLRFLAVDEVRARRARAASRERQVDALARLPGNAGRARAELYGALLSVERLCDAAADQELHDLGLGTEEIAALVAAAVRQAKGLPNKTTRMKS